MAVERTNTSGARQAPGTEPKQPTGSEQQKARDNTAASQAPKETKTAVQNTFGDIPEHGAKKNEPGDSPKQAAADTKAQPAPASAKNPTGSPIAPKTLFLVPDVKAPVTTQAYTGEPAKDANGLPVKTSEGYDVYLDKNKNPFAMDKNGFPMVDLKGNLYAVGSDGKFMHPEEGKFAVYDRNTGKLVASDAKTGTINADAYGHAYALDKNGQYTQPESGVFAVYDNAGRKVASDSKTGQIRTDQNGNPYALSEDGKYMQPDAGSFGVYEKNTGALVAVDGNGGFVVRNESLDQKSLDYAKAVDKNGKFLVTPTGANVSYDATSGELVAYDKNDMREALNPIKPYAIKPDGSYAVTASGNPVIYDYDNGNRAVAIDPKTGNAIRHPNGNILAIGETGDFLKTQDGRPVVYNPDNGNTLAAVDTATGKIMQDVNGKPYVVLPDGSYPTAGTGSDVVYDKETGNKPVAINPRDGAVVKGPRGQPLAIGENGDFLKTEAGTPVVYENFNGKFNPVATDAKGDVLVIEGYPIALDKYGKQLFNPEGLPIVYDKRGNQAVMGSDNKLITDQNGNVRAVGKFGQYLPDVVYDKASGFKVKLDANQRPTVFGTGVGPFVAVLDTGAPTTFTYDSRGDIVGSVGQLTPGGYEIAMNTETGQLQTGAGNGYIYKVDPATKDIARDADGKVLPPLYNPVDTDKLRPPVQPNGDAATTLKDLPKGTARVDPMQLKNELIDENGYLSPDNVSKALGAYDARDVYDALINGGWSGGWNGLDTKLPEGFNLKHPSPEQAREIVAAMLAWQKANGKYNPLKAGQLPPVIPYERSTGQDIKHTFNRNDGLKTERAGPAYLDLSMAPHTGGIPGNVFSSVTSSQVSPAFQAAYGSERPTGAFDIVTEYIASDWTGDKSSSFAEAIYKPGFEKIEQAVVQLGNGDRNTGMDLLKRAYFSGDVATIEELKKLFPPSNSESDYKTEGL